MMVSIHGIKALTLGLPGWTASNAGMVRGWRWWLRESMAEG